MGCWRYLVSIMSDSLAAPWTAAHQAPLFKGFSRQEYWSGLPFPSPGDPALADRFFTVEPPGKAQLWATGGKKKKMKYLEYFNFQLGASLVVQWLRIHLAVQRALVRSLVQEDPTRRGASQPMRQNY